MQDSGISIGWIKIRVGSSGFTVLRPMVWRARFNKLRIEWYATSLELMAGNEMVVQLAGTDREDAWQKV